MKVLLVDSSKLIAGAERSLMVLVNSIDYMPFTDILFDYKMPHQELYNLPSLNIRYRFRNSNKVIGYLESNSKYRICRGGKNLLKAFSLAWLLTKHNYDIVHFNMYRSSDISDIIVCKIFNIKIISHVRTLPSVISIPKLSRLLVDHFICVSIAVKDGFKLKSKATVIYNGIDFTLKYPIMFKKDFRKMINVPSSSILITSIGQLEYRKAHDNAIRVLPQLLRLFPKIMLMIVGNDPNPNQPELKRLRNLANGLDLKHRVLFRDFTNDIELLYRSSDIILSTTREGESFGRIPIEAAFYGSPCIVTNIGAFKETVIHKQTGLLYEPDDLVGLLNSIETLLKDEKLYYSIVKNAKKWVLDNFSGHFHRERVREIYRMVLGN